MGIGDWVQTLLSKKGANPDQPREPAGTPIGGRFTDAGGAVGDTAERSREMTIPDQGLKPAAKVRFARGSESDALQAATRGSAKTGVPYYVHGTHFGLTVSGDKPRLPHGQLYTKVEATHDPKGKTYTVKLTEYRVGAGK